MVESDHTDEPPQTNCKLWSLKNTPIFEPTSNGSLISPVNSTLLTLKEFDNG